MAGSDAAGPSDDTSPAKPDAFRLSRIQAEGWKAARAVAGTAAAVEAQAQRLNPYTSEIERTRWRAGFDAALARPRR